MMKKSNFTKIGLDYHEMRELEALFIKANPEQRRYIIKLNERYKLMQKER